MTSYSRSFDIRRARPLLGTIVEIRVRAASRLKAQVAISQAFAAVAKVHALMSPRERSSDVARINASPVGQSVRIDPQTYRVLAGAPLLSAFSDGVFYVTASRERQ